MVVGSRRSTNAALSKVESGDDGGILFAGLNAFATHQPDSSKVNRARREWVQKQPTTALEKVVQGISVRNQTTAKAALLQSSDGPLAVRNMTFDMSSTLNNLVCAAQHVDLSLLV